MSKRTSEALSNSIKTPDSNDDGAMFSDDFTSSSLPDAILPSKVREYLQTDDFWRPLVDFVDLGTLLNLRALDRWWRAFVTEELMVSSVDTSCLRMGVSSSESQVLVESFRLRLRHPSNKQFLKSAKMIFEETPNILLDFETIPMLCVKLDEFLKAIDNNKIVSCDSEFIYYECIENKDGAKISKRVTVCSFVLLDKGKLLSFTTSIEEPVDSNLCPPGAQILKVLNGRASSLAAGYEAANAISVDGGLAEIIGIFEAIRDAGATVVFQSGAADVYALWSTSAIGRFINCTFVGRSFETRLQSLFSHDSKNSLQWYDTYRNPVATAISRSLYGAIYGARISLTLTNMSKLLHELLGIGDVLGPDAHNAAHDAKFTLLLALWQARATNGGEVNNLCDEIEEMFLKVTLRQPAEAIAMLTTVGREAVETYVFIDGREGKREREENKWIHLLQVEVNERSWQESFRKYNEMFGDPLVFSVETAVNTEEQKLLQWGKSQRRAKKKGKLSEERVEKLEGIGFIWDLFEARWLEMAQLLVSYKKKFGDCLVKEDYKTADGVNLGKWVQKQRAAKKKRTLSKERVKILKDIGFVWVVGSGKTSKKECS